jgi:pyridoxal phosphate enzyme (YggS family)
MNNIAHNLRKVQDSIAECALGCGRTPEEITLLAITKTFPVETVRQAIAAGQRRFGENRVQEAEAKIRAIVGDSAIEWHLVGHLQTNKARRAAELFDVVHSLDSVKLARKLSEEGVARGKPLSTFLEIKLSEEQTKSGVSCEEVREIISQAQALPGIVINGLMTIPPYFEDPGQTEPFFRRLRHLRDELEREVPGCLGQKHLSMGMSHDYKAAIREGATILRIGTAIFGERHHG